MIRILLISLLLTGCATMTPDEAAMWQASGNFNYKADINDEWRIYDRIDQPFEGDCEDYALTLQKQIGGDVWFVSHRTLGPHAVLVKNHIAYDYLIGRPVSFYDYPGKFEVIINKETW